MAAARPADVRCQLLDDDGKPIITFAMPADAVPDEGRMWTVLVGEENEVQVADGEGRALERAARTLVERVPELPPPGRYRLTQAPLPDYR
jgi:hypothetical protein